MSVTVRPVAMADVEIFYAHQSDAEAAAMAGFVPRSREAHDAHWQRILADPTSLAWTIELDGQVCGNVGCWSDESRRLIGYWVDREVWGRGVATAAVRLVVAGIDERPLHAFVLATNVASIRVLQKVGFLLAAEQPTELAHDGIEERLYVLR